MSYHVVNVAVRNGMNTNTSENTVVARPDNVDIHKALVTLRKYKVEIFLLAALTTLIVYLALSTVTPVYRSSATLLINSSEKTKVVSVEELISSEATSENFQTQIEILRSKRLVQRVVEEMDLTTHWEFNPELDRPPEFDTENAIGQFLANFFKHFGSANASNAASDYTLNSDKVQKFAVNRLRSNVAIVPVKDTTLVRIKVDAEDPDMAFKIANQYGESYIEDILETKQKVTGKASVWLDKRLAGLKEKLVQSEARLVEFREKNGLVDLGGRVGGLKEQQIAVLTARSVDAEREKRELQVLLAEIDSVVGPVRSGDSEVSISVVDGARGRSPILKEYESLSVINSNSAVQQLRREMLDEERVLEELRTRYGEKHPLVISAKSNLDVAIQTLDIQIERIISSVRKQYDLAQANARALESQLNREERATYVLDRKQIEMNQLEREVEANRSLYRTFSTRARDANPSEGIGAAVIASISDPATISSNPVFPRTKFTLQVCFILSLLGFSFLAVMTEKYRNTVQGVDAVVSKLGLPMLGLVPLVRQKGRNRKIRTPIIPSMHYSKDGLFEESFKTIRTSLYLSSIDDKLIMVSSTLPAEGKSTIALNLAHSMSLVERVLLIEADMRRPTLSRIRNLRLRRTGLSNYLRDDIDLDLCINQVSNSHLDILPAGSVPDMPLEMLSSAKFDAMLTELSTVYDKIIIDTAPVAAVSDALMVGRLVDTTIFVTRADSTQIEDVKVSIERLQAAGIKITGVVVSKVDVTRVKSYGGASEYRGYVDGYGYSNNQRIG